MTKKDLTKVYVKKIAEELSRAFRYFDVLDEYDVRAGVKRKLEQLWDMVVCQNENTLHTNDGIVVGCPIMVAIGGEDFEDKVIDGKKCSHESIETLYLVVNAEDFQYVLSRFNVYHPRESKSWDDDIWDDRIYKKVKLEEVDKTKIGRSLY